MIVRHAKAEPADGVGDRERPLTARGRADAAAAGQWLVNQGINVDLVLCSPARRTRETWQAMAPAMTGEVAAEYPDDVYAAPADAALDLLTHLGDDVGTVVLVGHNPSVSDLTALLDPSAADEWLATAGIAVHTAEVPWSQWGARCAMRTASHTARG